MRQQDRDDLIMAAQWVMLALILAAVIWGALK